jgi:hypothetical protein
MSDHGLLDGLLQCRDHECPMIAVEDNYVCVLEYVDTEIGGLRVIDIVDPDDPDEPVSLVFETGRRLPLLCPCCGGPLNFSDDVEAEQFLDDAAGMCLYALGYHPLADEEPESLELVFVPSLPLPGDDELPAEHQSLLIHLDSVRQCAAVQPVA